MTTETPSSTPIADAVRHYLDTEGWKYTPHDSEGMVMFSAGVTLPNGEFRSSFDADDGNERFAIYVYSSVYIPESRRLAVAEFITRVNYTRFLGKIEMDLDDGEIRSVTSVTVEGSQLSQAMIDRLENSAHFNLNDAYPGIMAVAFAETSPQQAFESYQKKGNETQVDDVTPDSEEVSA